MISDKMATLVKNSSVIRAMFEEGKKMAAEFGRENVYDFSLGNPSVQPPKAVTDAIVEVAYDPDMNYVHGYMSNVGFDEVRDKIAASINKRFGTAFTKGNIVMTVGAAGGMNVIFKVLLNPGDEVITFSPFFGEYRNYVSNFDGKLIELAPNTETFQPNVDALEESITPRTKALIVNSPNNPTGVVYSRETLNKIAAILEKKQKELGTSIYIVSDEPYRELAYDGVEVPYIPQIYRNTIVGYSFSKSLSLPGDRIGYLAIPSEIDDFDDVFAAAGVATRILGFVNAPSLAQLFVSKCLDEKVDLDIYNRNRELLYNSLRKYGYECIKPEGAFYLFVKALEPDDKAFAAKAKEKRLLLVPGSTFGCAGYVRIAYCVDYDMILRSLPAFEALAAEY
ncbi:MAG: pyridoxal phosphate-dependent aminotransferase [Lachnospiraceae bacterium]|nr:pyridoxal phosphate-dependent aminotransferase [Lachnospiraceae bacterium]MCR5769432.1 pyridoxal phosphate-dependent aminotransferase [Lachnospiraceae bacterium]